MLLNKKDEQAMVIFYKYSNIGLIIERKDWKSVRLIFSKNTVTEEEKEQSSLKIMKGGETIVEICKHKTVRYVKLSEPDVTDKKTLLGLHRDKYVFNEESI